MTVQELNRDQLIQLKQEMLMEQNKKTNIEDLCLTPVQEATIRDLRHAYIDCLVKGIGFAYDEKACAVIAFSMPKDVEDEYDIEAGKALVATLPEIISKGFSMTSIACLPVHSKNSGECLKLTKRIKPCNRED